MVTLEVVQGRHACPVCPARFHEVGDKKRHIRSEHPRPKGASNG